MKRFAAMVVGLMVFFSFARAGIAQDRTPEELDQMLGPIALYPDPLIAEILSAATFPDQIVVADRYMQGGGDVNEVAQQPWDPSVQGMCHYANVLKWLDDNLQWTTQLGQAYTSQPSEVMDSIQRLRTQAQTLGNLPSTPEETVTDDNGDIEIEPADPNNIYVPDYSATTIYYQPGIFCTFGFGFPIGGWLVHDWDWHSHRMIAWGPGHPRPDNWWRQSPVERRGYFTHAHVPTWHGGARGTIVNHPGWERGYAPAVVSRSVPAPAVPRSAGERIVTERSAGERIAQGRAEAKPAFRAPSPELPRNFARPAAPAPVVRGGAEVRGGGEVFGGVKALRQFESRAREAQKAAAIWAAAVVRMAAAMANVKRGLMKRTILTLLGFSLLPCVVLAAQEEHFSSSDEAIKALRSAADSKNTNALETIFGPALRGLISADPVQASNGLAVFSRRMSEKVSPVKESDSKVELDIGFEAWPFPIPLVKEGAQWFFDTSAGQEEILNRRVGNNELDTIRVCNAYVDAQRQFANSDRDGDGVVEYAQHLRSSPEKHDGLYWHAEPGEDESPFGPLIAAARGEGYRHESKIMSDADAQHPYHGYFFKVLTRQGKHAPGGKYNYVINGHMVAGFALVAWPAEWGNSGVMTFIVNQSGKVYEANLGPKTASIAVKMTEYEPDSRWKPVE